MLCRNAALQLDEHEQHQRLLASVLHLMSAHARRSPGGCALLAEVVGRHLEDIARSDESSAVLRATCSDLAADWKARAGVPETCPRKPWWTVRPAR